MSLTGSTQTDEESTTLTESEGTVSIHTFTLSSPPPAEGLTVSVSSDALDDFNLDAIEATSGTISNLQEGGFDFTITEREATISLPVLADDLDEGSETAIFTLEPGDNYEINTGAGEATFTLSDTLDQSLISEESESGQGRYETSNSTIPEADALSLRFNNPSVSINGLIAQSFADLPEDVDFFSFDLEAGQTVSLDIDTEEALVNGNIDFRPVVYPALSEILQKPDTEHPCKNNAELVFF